MQKVEALCFMARSDQILYHVRPGHFRCDTRRQNSNRSRNSVVPHVSQLRLMRVLILTPAVLVVERDCGIIIPRDTGDFPL